MEEGCLSLPPCVPEDGRLQCGEPLRPLVTVSHPSPSPSVPPCDTAATPLTLSAQVGGFLSATSGAPPFCLVSSNSRLLTAPLATLFSSCFLAGCWERCLLGDVVLRTSHARPGGLQTCTISVKPSTVFLSQGFIQRVCCTSPVLGVCLLKVPLQFNPTDQSLKVPSAHVQRHHHFLWKSMP